MLSTQHRATSKISAHIVMSIQQISAASIVTAVDDHISCDLAGEAAILNFSSGLYYGLDEVGARVWKLISEPKSVIAIRDSIVEEYDVDPDRCERDLIALLTELADKGLVKVDEKPGR